MASALVFLGISIILFLMVYGIIFTVAASVLGAVFTVITDAVDNIDMDDSWRIMYNDVQGQTQYLLPLIMSLGIVIFIIKVLMAAGVIGRD